MAGNALIDAYAAELCRRLPAPVVDELTDGLVETYDRTRADGAESDAAARAAIAEFGSVDAIVEAFVRESPGRRAAIGLLASGPIVGACWGLSLVIGQAWSWPLPRFVALAFGVALAATVASLLLAAGTRRSYRRTRVAAAGCVGLMVLDIGMIAAALAVAPALVWPMTVAIPASVLRLGITARRLPNVVAVKAI